MSSILEMTLQGNWNKCAFTNDLLFTLLVAFTLMQILRKTAYCLNHLTETVRCGHVGGKPDFLQSPFKCNSSFLVFERDAGSLHQTFLFVCFCSSSVSTVCVHP